MYNNLQYSDQQIKKRGYDTTICKINDPIYNKSDPVRQFAKQNDPVGQCAKKWSSTIVCKKSSDTDTVTIDVKIV